MKTDFLKTIVAAIDTSALSRSVLKETLVLASSIRAKVVLVSVTPQYEGNMHRVFIKDAEQQMNEPFRKILKEATEYATSLGVTLDTVHRMGKPCDQIAAVAQEEGAGLILLGSAKRSQVERMLLGRTVAEIIANGPCDVMLIPEGAEVRFRRILVGINGSPASREAGERALEVAESYGSEVHALCAIDIPSDRALRYGVQRDAEQKGRKSVQSFMKTAQEREIPVITRMTTDSPEKSLTEYARENDIHLIVLGTKRTAGVLDMFCESVTEGVSALSSCPVLVVKHHHLVKTNQMNSAFS